MVNHYYLLLDWKRSLRVLFSEEPLTVKLQQLYCTSTKIILAHSEQKNFEGPVFQTKTEILTTLQIPLLVFLHGPVFPKEVEYTLHQSSLGLASKMLALPRVHLIKTRGPMGIELKSSQVTLTSSRFESTALKIIQLN